MSVGKKVKQSGFTLIELLVTIAVLVILATIAVPNFQDMIVRNRLSADFNQVLTGMHYARSEAAKRRTDVSVEISASGAAPWKLEVKSGASGAVSTLRTIEAEDSRVTIDPASFSVTFNPLGRRASCSVADPCSLSVSYKDEKKMNINLAGNINRP